VLHHSAECGDGQSDAECEGQNRKRSLEEESPELHGVLNLEEALLHAFDTKNLRAGERVVSQMLHTYIYIVISNV
jgi:hypothetical protein